MSIIDLNTPYQWHNAVEMSLDLSPCDVEEKGKRKTVHWALSLVMEIKDVEAMHFASSLLNGRSFWLKLDGVGYVRFKYIDFIKDRTILKAVELCSESASVPPPQPVWSPILRHPLVAIEDEK